MSKQTEQNPTTFEADDKWHFVSKAGEVRRYVVDRTEIGPPGLAVFLKCLESPHAPVAGYRGGESREARVLAASWMRERPGGRDGGWLPGHP